ncbi:hypothetical protein AB0M44_48745 [Streptosporangium subroseum]|uniref:hypothetical protein n=1 Tax=Streptosporangium subroseum TaxID=106412 RepID=UPI003412B619
MEADPAAQHRPARAGVAGLCTLLRTEVIEIIDREQRGEEKTKVFPEPTTDWRKLLFPGLIHEEFFDPPLRPEHLDAARPVDLGGLLVGDEGSSSSPISDDSGDSARRGRPSHRGPHRSHPSARLRPPSSPGTPERRRWMQLRE